MTTQSGCNALGGIWTEGLDCTESCPVGLQYCEAGSGMCEEHITDVTVGTISNLGTGCGTGGYTDFTAMSTDMQIGTGYLCAVVNGDPYANDQCGIWVDWNYDGDFYDADEAMVVSGTPGTGPYAATITPPTGSSLGQTTMRIRITDRGLVDPCGLPTYGEVEDYTVNVVP